MNTHKELKSVLKKYADHPEFIGIDLVDVNQRGAVDNAPIHIAAGKGDVGDIDVLVTNGADVNAPGDLGNTPLHFAALMGQLNVVKRLIDLGADRGALNEFRQTPLDSARSVGEKDIVELLNRYKK